MSRSRVNALQLLIYCDYRIRYATSMCTIPLRSGIQHPSSSSGASKPGRSHDADPPRGPYELHPRCWLLLPPPPPPLLLLLPPLLAWYLSHQECVYSSALLPLPLLLPLGVQGSLYHSLHGFRQEWRAVGVPLPMQGQAGGGAGAGVRVCHSLKP